MRPILAVIGSDTSSAKTPSCRGETERPDWVVPGKSRCCQQSARPSKQSDVSLEGPPKRKMILILSYWPTVPCILTYADRTKGSSRAASASKINGYLPAEFWLLVCRRKARSKAGLYILSANRCALQRSQGRRTGLLFKSKYVP
jgi:hypothetical protein